MDQITGSAATGLTSLATNYGVAGILAVLLIVGGTFMLRYFMNEFKACHDSTKQALDKNTDAFNGVQVALAKLEIKLDGK